MESYTGKFVPNERVFTVVKDALKERRGFSLVRLGDGEVQFMAHDCIVPSEQLKNLRDFEYSGVKLPDHRGREELVRAAKKSDVVGLFHLENNKPDPLVQKVLSHYRLSFPITCSYKINWWLYRKDLLRLLKGRRVLLVGRRAREGVKRMKEMGLDVCPPVNLEGMDNIPETYEVISRMNFEVALISAGIPAVVLAVMVKENLNRIAIDFGHVIEKVIDRNFGIANPYKAVYDLKARWRFKDSRVREGSLIKGSGPEIYLIRQNKKHLIISPQFFARHGLNPKSVVRVRDEDLKNFPDGEPIMH